MLTIAARDIFLKLADDANIWSEISKAGKQKNVGSLLFNDMAKKALENNPAFLEVHEKATYDNIATKVWDYAKKHGTLDKLKNDLSPKKLIEKLNALKVKQSDQKKTVKETLKTQI